MSGRSLHLARHRSEVGEFELARRAPDPRLRAHVDAYFGYSERTATFVRRREAPIPGMVLIVGLGPPLRFLDPRDPARPGRRHVHFVGGAHDSYVVTETDGAQAGVQVNFTPLGAYMFARVAMHTLANRVVDLEDLLGRESDRLAERLDAAPDWATRFDVLDAFIVARLAGARPPSREVAWAWRRLSESHGLVRVGALAAELGRSRKHVVAQFREQVGLPPKTLGRIVRFNRVVGLLERADGMSWAEMAYSCGYYDQAHLNRDFRQFTGGTPTEFVAARLPHLEHLVSD